MNVTAVLCSNQPVPARKMFCFSGKTVAILLLLSRRCGNPRMVETHTCCRSLIEWRQRIASIPVRITAYRNPNRWGDRGSPGIVFVRMSCADQELHLHKPHWRRPRERWIWRPGLWFLVRPGLASLGRGGRVGIGIGGIGRGFRVDGFLGLGSRVIFGV